MPINIYPHSVKIKQSNEYTNATKILGLERDAEVLENLNNKQTEILTILQNKKEAINNSLNELSQDYVQYMGNSKSTVISEITSSATSAVDDYINNRISYEYYVTPQRFKEQDETDDAIAINAAIDYAVKNKCIVRLKGTYYCETPIYCRTNTSLIGTGLGRVNYTEQIKNGPKLELGNTETIIESSANPVIAIYGRYRSGTDDRDGCYHTLDLDGDKNTPDMDAPTRGQVHLKNLNIRSRNFDDQIAENPSDEIKNTQINRRKSQVGILLRPHNDNGTTWKNFFQRCNIRGFGIGVKFDNNKDNNNYEDCSSENLFLHCKIYDCMIGVQCKNNQSLNNTFIQTDIQARRAPMGPAIDIYSGGGFNFYGCSIMNRGEVLRTSGIMKHCIINIDSCRIEDISNGDSYIYQTSDPLKIWGNYTDKMYVPTPSYLFGAVNPRFKIINSKNNNDWTVTLIPLSFPEQISKLSSLESDIYVNDSTPRKKQDIISPYFKSNSFSALNGIQYKKDNNTYETNATDYYINNDNIIGNNNTILSPALFQYQWEQYNGGVWSEIEGATSNTYIITYVTNMQKTDNSAFRKYRCKITNGTITKTINNNNQSISINYLPEQGYYTEEIKFITQDNKISLTSPTSYVYGNAGSSQSAINITNCMILMHNWGYKKYLFYGAGRLQANINNIFMAYNTLTPKLEIAKTQAYELMTGRKKLAYTKINATNIFDALPSNRDITIKDSTTGASGEYIGSIKQMNIFCNSSTSDGWQKLPINYDISGFGASCGSLNFIKFGRNNINANLSDSGKPQTYAFELPPYLTLIKTGIRHYGKANSEVILQAIDDTTRVTTADNPQLNLNNESEIITLGNYTTGNIIKTAPTITATVDKSYVKQNDTITFTVATTNITGTPTYQWQSSSTPTTDNWSNITISGSGYNTNTFSFTVNNESDINGKYYRCKVTDANGTWYSNYVNTEWQFAAIANQNYAYKGNQITISLNPENHFENVSYQWQFSSNNATWSNTTLTGNKTASLSFEATVGRINGKYYRCMITDNNNNILYSNIVNIKWGDVIISSNLIKAQLNDNITFNATVNNASNITYQWQISHDNGENWINILDANTDTYTFKATRTLIDGKLYRCVVTNENIDYYSNIINIEWDTSQLATYGGYSEFYFNNDNPDLLLTGSKEDFKKGHYFLQMKRSDLCDVYLYYI